MRTGGLHRRHFAWWIGGWALLAGCQTGGEENTGAEMSTGTTTDATAGQETLMSDEGGTGESTGGDEATGADVESGAEESGADPEPVELELMNEVVFYDGYADVVDLPEPEGVVRHRNDLYATKMTDEQIDSLQSTLAIGVIIGALCDNYDRIGSVYVSMVPKGSEIYDPDAVDRIEVARFVTPFMDMNREPDWVPFQFEADNLIPILKDPDLRAQYDMWFELSVFGVPYAARNEIAGCEGRDDTQLGTLLLFSDSTREAQTFSGLLPLAVRDPFNNYAEGASDELGTTRKTLTFELEQDTQHAQLVLITSNHGANAGGEEYSRREHNVYVDGNLALQYRPGRESCEPFRRFNTQGNGIYGSSPKSDEEWQSFSNWCPGDVIDTRIIEWGAVSAGVHEFVIDVPDAEFRDEEGNFPFSLYVQTQ